GADSGHIARCENRVEFDAALEQFGDRSAACLFAGIAVDPKPVIGLDPARVQRPAIAAPTLEEFRKSGRCRADKGNSVAALLKQVSGGVEAALLIVRGDDRAKLPGGGRAPAHEMRAARDELLQARPVIEIVAIAEQDDA